MCLCEPHCPKNEQNLRIKTEPVTAFVYIHLAPKLDTYCCIRSSCDRLGFYAKIQIIFGTVCAQYRIAEWVVFLSCSK